MISSCTSSLLYLSSCRAISPYMSPCTTSLSYELSAHVSCTTSSCIASNNSLYDEFAVHTLMHSKFIIQRVHHTLAHCTCLVHNKLIHRELVCSELIVHISCTMVQQAHCAMSLLYTKLCTTSLSYMSLVYTSYGAHA